MYDLKVAVQAPSPSCAGGASGDDASGDDPTTTLTFTVGNPCVELVAGEGGFLEQMFGDVGNVELRAKGFIVPQDGLHADEVDHALEGVFRADGNL
jgi:hypothetical protein